MIPNYRYVLLDSSSRSPASSLAAVLLSCLGFALGSCTHLCSGSCYAAHWWTSFVITELQCMIDGAVVRLKSWFCRRQMGLSALSRPWHKVVPKAPAQRNVDRCRI